MTGSLHPLKVVMHCIKYTFFKSNVFQANRFVFVLEIIAKKIILSVRKFKSDLACLIKKPSDFVTALKILFDYKIGRKLTVFFHSIKGRSEFFRLRFSARNPKKK